jgi:transcriptional regulator
MLLDRHDDPRSDAEWQAVLAGGTFGQFVVNGPDGFPLVVPTHYAYSVDRGVEFHLHRKNPAFPALAATDGRAGFAVLDAPAYIPTPWNARTGADPAWAAPTSYFAAVQVFGRATVIRDEAGIAEVLNRQLAHLQPEGGHHAVAPGANPFGKMIPGILAVRLEVEHVRARLKFGDDHTTAERERINQHLETRGSDDDRRAAAHQRRRMGR